MDAQDQINYHSHQLHEAQNCVRQWQAEVDAMLAKCEVLESAKDNAFRMERGLANMDRGSSYREASSWDQVVGNASQYYASCCHHLNMYRTKVNWAQDELQKSRRYVEIAERNLEVARRQKRWEEQERLRIQRERLAREAMERERMREKERFTREAKERERLRERMREQQAREDEQKRLTLAITTQRVKSFRLQVTEMFKDYAALTTFPDPPVEVCKQIQCVSATRVLEACPCNIKKCFTGLGVKGLRMERVKWHPDRFAKCQAGRAVVGQLQAKAKEVFVVVDALYEEAKAKEKKW